jgi:hypothetical protein
MWRWFGYRPDYEDLCRLFTTSDLRNWYREITVASEELRADFDDMAARKGTPEDYGLRVRQSPAGLSVTSPTKMRSASTVRLTFSGDISESVTFSTRSSDLDENWQTLVSFVGAVTRECGAATIGPSGNFLWQDVPGQLVIDEFFQTYRAERMARRARPELIRRYISDALKVDELTDWTVVLVNNKQKPKSTETISGLNVGLTYRGPLDQEEPKNSQRYTIRRVLNPVDEGVDLTPDQYKAGLAELSEHLRAKSPDADEFVPPKTLTGPSLRRQRSSRNGLLVLYPLAPDFGVEQPMVGFAASFPFSVRAQPATYKVNEIWTLLAFDQLEDDDDDQ